MGLLSEAVTRPWGPSALIPPYPQDAMFLFSKFSRPARPARSGHTQRARLRLEQLDDRAAPSTVADSDLLSPDGTDDVALMAPPGPTAAPVIDQFSAAEIDHGLYLFTGHVTATPAGGLTVNFGGVPSLQGQSTTTNADGTFSIAVTVKTDGSDHGTVWAQAIDAKGQVSNVALTDINPTP